MSRTPSPGPLSVPSAILRPLPLHHNLLTLSHLYLLADTTRSLTQPRRLGYIFPPTGLSGVDCAMATRQPSPFADGAFRTAYLAERAVVAEVMRAGRYDLLVVLDVACSFLRGRGEVLGCGEGEEWMEWEEERDRGGMEERERERARWEARERRTRGGLAGWTYHELLEELVGDRGRVGEVVEPEEGEYLRQEGEEDGNGGSAEQLREVVEEYGDLLEEWAEATSEGARMQLEGRLSAAQDEIWLMADANEYYYLNNADLVWERGWERDGWDGRDGRELVNACIRRERNSGRPRGCIPLCYWREAYPVSRGVSGLGRTLGWRERARWWDWIERVGIECRADVDTDSDEAEDGDERDSCADHDG